MFFMTPEAKAAKAAKAAARKAAKLAAKGVAGANNSALQETIHVPASEIIITKPELEKLPLNKVVFRLYQDTVKMVNKVVKGQNGQPDTKIQVQKPVKHDWEVSFETEKPITTRALAVWLTAQLANYQTLQQYQGRSRFDQSLEIKFDMQVNDRGAATGIKFSTNAKTIEKIFDTRCPIVIGHAFGAQTYDSYDNTPAGMKRIQDETMMFVKGDLNLVLANRVPSQADLNVEAVKQLTAPVVDPTVNIPLNN